jgi:hypothetical protein
MAKAEARAVEQSIRETRPTYPHIALNLMHLRAEVRGNLLILASQEWPEAAHAAFKALCEAFDLRESQRLSVYDAIQREIILAALTASIVP